MKLCLFYPYSVKAALEVLVQEGPPLTLTQHLKRYKFWVFSAPAFTDLTPLKDVERKVFSFRSLENLSSHTSFGNSNCHAQILTGIIPKQLKLQQNFLLYDINSDLAAFFS